MTDIQVIAPDGTPGTIPDDQLDAAKAAGYSETTAESLPEVQDIVKAVDIGPEGTYNVVAPDGVQGTVPTASLKEALQSNYKLASVYAEDVANKDKIDSFKKELLSGNIPLKGIPTYHSILGQYFPNAQVGAYNALRSWPGFDSIVEKVATSAGETPENIKAYYEAQHQLDEERETAATAGKVVGFGEQAIVGGELASAAAPTVAKGIAAAKITNPVATTILSKAAEGALFNAPDAAAELINSNPQKAAEDIAIGAIGNVALHGLFSLGGKLTEGLKPTAATELANAAEEQKRIAVNTISKELGVPPSAADKAADVIPKLIEQKIISRTDTLEQALKKVQNLDESGPEIGKAVKKLDAEVGNTQSIISGSLAKASQTINDLMPEVAERKAAQIAIKSAETEVQDAAANLALSQEKLSKVPIKIINGFASEAFTAAGEEIKLRENSLKTAVDKYNEINAKLVPLSPSSKQALKALKPILEEIDSASRKGTFSATQGLKKFIGEQTNFSKDNLYVNDLRKRAYGITRQSIMEAEDVAAKRLGDPDILSQLQKNRAFYAWNKVMEKYVDKTANKEVMHSTLESLSSMHTERHGIAGLIGHALLGGYGTLAGVGVSVGLNVLKKITKANKLGNAIGAFEDATSMVAKAGAKRDAKILSGIKDVLSSSGTAPVAKAAFTQALARYVPESEGKSHQNNLRTLQASVASANGSPEILSNHLARVVAPLREAGLEPVANAYTEHQLRLMKVLQTILPKDPKMIMAHPFAPNVDINEISPAVKAKYERALTVAAEPEVLLNMIKNNTITAYDVAIAAAVNPATLQKMRDAFVDEALKSKPNLSYQKRLSIGIFMGSNIDASTEQLPVLQSVYAATPPVGTTGVVGGKGGKSHLSAKAQDNLDNSHMTVSQKDLQL